MRYAFSHLFSYIMEAVLLWRYASCLFDKKRSSCTGIAVLGALYALLFAVSLSEHGWWNVSFCILADFIFLTSQYRIKYLRSFFHSALLPCAAAAGKLAAFCLVENYLPYFWEMDGSLCGLIIYAILNKAIYFTVIYVLLFLFRGSKEYDGQTDAFLFLSVGIPVTAVFIILTFVRISASSFKMTSSFEELLLISDMILLLINFVTMPPLAAQMMMKAFCLLPQFTYFMNCGILFQRHRHTTEHVVAPGDPEPGILSVAAILPAQMIGAFKPVYL